MTSDLKREFENVSQELSDSLEGLEYQLREAVYDTNKALGKLEVPIRSLRDDLDTLLSTIADMENINEK